jgi:hypothetical protein
MAKVHNREDTEDRALIYRMWRWTFGGSAYCFDVDHIEWRRDHTTRKMYPIAVMELTRPDHTVICPQAYLPKVVARYNVDSPQGQHLHYVAGALEVPLWIVVFELEGGPPTNQLAAMDVSIGNRFWIYNATSGGGWYRLDRATYREWMLRDCPMEIAEHRRVA